MADDAVGQPEVMESDCLPAQIRRAVTGDRPALTEMLERCSHQNTRHLHGDLAIGQVGGPYLAGALADRYGAGSTLV